MSIRLLCALVLLSFACHEAAPLSVEVKQASGGGRQTDTFIQEEAPRPIDILFVVDESGSMIEELLAFRQAARVWVEDLTTADVDFHLATITADGPSSPGAAVFKGPDTVLTRDTVDVGDKLAERFDSQAFGSGVEVPFLTTTQALSEPLLSAENAGFLRSNAALAVIIISDEDDQSELTVDEARAHFATLKGGAEHVQLVAFGAEDATTCAGAAMPSTRLKEWADLFLSVCENHDDGLDAIELPAGPRTTFALSSLPVPETLQVAVAGIPLHQSFWEYDATDNAIHMVGGFVPAEGETITVSYDVVTTCLQNGEIVEDLFGGKDSWSLLSLCAPPGTTELLVHSFGGKGDPDLYLKLNDVASAENHDARSAEHGVDETIVISTPPGERWSLGVHGFAAYDGLSVQAIFY